MKRPSSSCKLASGWGFCVALTLLGCGEEQAMNPAGAASVEVALEVAQVTTLTTVQASTGLYLSPSARQKVPSYVAQGAPRPRVVTTDGGPRAKVDLALVFQSLSDEPSALEAELSAPAAGARESIEHYFPDLVTEAQRVRWPLQTFRGGSVEAGDVASEWSGWQAFGGLRVRRPGFEEVGAPAATLDYQWRGAPAPLVLTLNEADELVVTNQSGQTVDRALLVYSHSGGVAITAIGALGPGASRITTLGPKERPPEQLLERARAVLADFFAASVESSLAQAMASAKSIPFLETHGFRLISLLNVDPAAANLRLTGPGARLRQVVVSHSEILKVEEETHILEVVADTSLDTVRAVDLLGRFAEAKLELAAASADATVSMRGQMLLDELRSW